MLDIADKDSLLKGLKSVGLTLKGFFRLDENVGKLKCTLCPENSNFLWSINMSSDNKKLHLFSHHLAECSARILEIKNSYKNNGCLPESGLSIDEGSTNGDSISPSFLDLLPTLENSLVSF